MALKTKSDSISAKQLLAHIEKYKKQLHESDTVKSTKFDHMQSALHGVKLIVHAMAGTTIKDKDRIAWIK